MVTEPDLDRALTLAREGDCDVVANYTAFRAVRRALARADSGGARSLGVAP